MSSPAFLATKYQDRTPEKHDHNATDPGPQGAPTHHDKAQATEAQPDPDSAFHAGRHLDRPTVRSMWQPCGSGPAGAGQPGAQRGFRHVWNRRRGAEPQDKSLDRVERIFLRTRNGHHRP